MSESNDYDILVMPERLDTLHAPNVELELMSIIEKGTTKLACDLSNTTYVASAGLRVLLLGFKKLKAVQGSFILLGVKEDVMKILKMSGFAQLMDIRESL